MLNHQIALLRMNNFHHAPVQPTHLNEYRLSMMLALSKSFSGLVEYLESLIEFIARKDPFTLFLDSNDTGIRF